MVSLPDIGRAGRPSPPVPSLCAAPCRAASATAITAVRGCAQVVEPRSRRDARFRRDGAAARSCHALSTHPRPVSPAKRPPAHALPPARSGGSVHGLRAMLHARACGIAPQRDRMGTSDGRWRPELPLPPSMNHSVLGECGLYSSAASTKGSRTSSKASLRCKGAPSYASTAHGHDLPAPKPTCP
jgi:hypothetical protein